MLNRILFGARSLFHNVPNQLRPFATSNTNVVPDQVSRYFRRAKFIDKIRLSLRSEAVSTDSLVALLDTPNLDSFVVTHALRTSPSPESALSLVDALKRVPNFVHSEHTLRAICKTLAKSGSTARLKKLVDSINAGEFPEVKPIGYLDCMRLYAVAGDIESVLSVWEQVRVEGKRPCAESYNVVMGMYVQMGKDLEAVEVFRSLLQVGAVPNGRTLSIVIEHLVKAGKVDEGKKVFDLLARMKIKRTLKQYSLIVTALTDLKKFDVVKSVLDEMRIEGVMPPRSMLSSLQQLQEAGILEETDEFVKEMTPDDRIEKIQSGTDHRDDDVDDEEEEEEDGGGNVEDHSSNADVGATLLKPWLDPLALATALRHWRPDDVSALENANLVWTSRLVCKMIRRFNAPETVRQFFYWVAHQPGFKHDVHTYSGVILKLASKGKVDLINDILLEMRKEDIKLGFNTIRQIIDFYGLSRSGDAAMSVFHDLKQLCGNLSGSNMLLLYSSLLRTLLKCERDSDAMDMVENMISRGVYPDVPTLSGLIHNFAMKGDFRTVQNLFGIVRRSGKEPDAYMYGTLIHAYCKYGKATLALRFFENMRGSNFTPDRATKSKLVRSLWKEGRLKEASMVEETCKVIDNSLPHPSPSFLFNISSIDLQRVCKIYWDSFGVSNN